MKKIIMIAAAFTAIFGCDKISGPEGDYGYIRLAMSVDADVVATRAAQEVTYEEAAQYNVKLSFSGSEVFAGEYGDVPQGQWTVKPGLYNVYMENLSVGEAYAEAKGLVRVADYTDVLVTPSSLATCPMELVPANSKVSFLYSENFMETFGITGKIDVSVKGPAAVYGAERLVGLKMDLSTQADDSALDYAFFEPVQHTWTFTVGGSKTYSQTFTPAAGQWKQYMFDVNNEDGKIKVTITVDDEVKEVTPVDAVIDPTI